MNIINREIFKSLFSDSCVLKIICFSLAAFRIFYFYFCFFLLCLAVLLWFLFIFLLNVVLLLKSVVQCFSSILESSQPMSLQIFFLCNVSAIFVNPNKPCFVTFYFTSMFLTLSSVIIKFVLLIFHYWLFLLTCLTVHWISVKLHQIYL